VKAITAAALSSSRFTLASIALMVIAGTSTYFSLPSREDPEILIRVAAVSAQYPGMSPERVEQLIAEPIEDAIKEIPEIENITTVVQTGAAIIKPEINQRYSNLEPIWQSLRNKMEDIKPTLPSGTYGPYVDDDFGSVAAATLVVTGDDFNPAELKIIADNVADAAAELPLVAKTELYGVQEERVWLEVNQDLLSQYGYSPTQLMSLLQSQNVVSPGGAYTVDGQVFVLEPTGSFESLEDIKLLPIQVPGHDALLYLQDIANIYRDYVDPIDSPVYFNGKAGIAIAVEAVSETNNQQFGDDLLKEITQLRKRLPTGAALDIATFQPKLVAEAVNNATSNLLQTVGIVLVVVMLFLGVRTGLIVGAIVPMTMMATLLGMAAWGIELHRTSIAAVIISLGLLVDNGIVIAEEISRRLKLGEARMDATLNTVTELSWPLLSSTLTTILAFMPLMLAENTAGEFLRSLAQVIIITLLASWTLAVVIIPCFCFWLIPDPDATDRKATQEARLTKIYRGVLSKVLKNRAVTMGVTLLLLLLAAQGFKLVPKQFMSASDRPQFLVYLDQPAGTHIEETTSATLQLSKWLSSEGVNPEIKSSIAYVDNGGPRFYLALSPPNAASYRSYVVVNTHSSDQVLPMMDRVEEYLRTQLPWVRARAEQLYMGPSPIGTVELRFSGPDSEELKNLSAQVQGYFHDIPGTRHIRDDWDNPILNFKVVVNQELARRAGVSSDAIASSLSGMIDGLKVTDYREGKDVIPVMIKADEYASDRLDKMGSMNIASSDNNVAVPLLQVARIEGNIELPQVRRRNQTRTITIYARHVNLQASELYDIVAPQLEKMALPAGYTFELGGELESSSEANSALFQYLPHCLLLIVLLLILQFNSLRRPLVILGTIPLIVIGAVVGLLVSGVYFSFTGMLGMFSLAGIIVNNGIVLTNKVDLEREAGASVHDALLTACQTRMRPILMTSLTTILGLMPLLLFGGEFWIAMAVVMVAGLAVGSLLTLLFVPVLYSLLFDSVLSRWADRKLG
jgi:multidrug efflux pump